jgi:probable HAF family extracellular repeat protein
MAMKTNRSSIFCQFARIQRSVLRTLVFISAAAPGLVLAQYSEIKMGEYLHYAVAAANGGVYAGIDGIGYTTIFGTPSVYQTNTGWVDLPGSLGFTNTGSYGQPKGISHDGSVVAGYMVGVVSNGISTQFATYWVNSVESLVPAPPDDPNPTIMSATGVSGDGTTLIVQDQTPTKTESYVFKIAGGTFTSLGFLPGTNQQTYATTINNNGTVVAGYYNLDNGDIHGFIWDATNGLRDMGIPTVTHPNTHYLEPTCISDDGTTVFGQLTEWNGWLGFRYNTTIGFQDLGDMTPSACTADGTEAVGIQNMYFPAAWSVGNGGGYLDHLLSANGTTQALGTVEGPVTISPDGSAITTLGPDVYLTDRTWYGTWQIFLPVPLKTAPIAPSLTRLSTAYATPLIEPAGTLIQYAEFNNGASALLDRRPSHAASFVFGADGSFSYTPQAGFSNRTDHFYYQLVSTNGTSLTNQVQIYVAAPAAPTVDTPTAASVTATTATLGGNVSSDGGAPITAIGVVYSPTAVNSNPQLGGAGVSVAFGTGTTGVFTVNVSDLTPGTDYSFAAFATNSLGAGYSQVGIFTTPWTPQSWQVAWYGSPTNSAAAWNADPYHTGVQNFAVFAFLGPYQDPSTASVTQLPQVQLSGGNLFYSFTEPFGVSGITYGAFWSTTLAPNDWHPVADTGDPTTVPPGHVFSVPTGANPQLFMRLTVTFQ